MHAAVRSGTTRSSLLARLRAARQRTDALFALIPDALLFERPIRLRHPFAFYIGHLEAFDWNLLSPRFGARRAPSALDRLFAFGIDPGDTDQPAAEFAWPVLGEIRRYAASTRADLDRLLPKALDAERFDEARDDSVARLIDVAIEHRLMHAETLAYLVNASPAMPRRVRAAPIAATFRSAEMVRIPAGAATLGLERSSREFGWDNEYDAHAVDVGEFEISRRMVTNAEYLAFVEAGGYDDPGWWTADDWAWRERRGVRHPEYWMVLDGRWHWRGLLELVALPPDWPVYVSHAEARAYAAWAGARLPSEAEWHRAAYGTPEGRERAYPWGDAAPAACHGNFDFRRTDPESVDAAPAGDSAFGVRGLAGNGWEWTSTPFAPFAGFRPFDFYPGYSQDFFDGQHFVLKGGSAATAAPLLRRSFRNWFQPHYPYVYAGFRLARS